VPGFGDTFLGTRFWGLGFGARFEGLVLKYWQVFKFYVFFLSFFQKIKKIKGSELTQIV
jgi:hypothetical protein